MKGLVDSALKLNKAEEQYDTHWTCYLHTEVEPFQGKEMKTFWNMMGIFRDELHSKRLQQVAIDNLLSACHEKEDYKTFVEWIRFTKTWHNIISEYQNRLWHVVGFKELEFYYFCEALVLIGEEAHKVIQSDKVYALGHNQFYNKMINLEEVRLVYSISCHNDYLTTLTTSCKDWYKKMCETLND
jgi:hypothetical protein